VHQRVQSLAASEHEVTLGPMAHRFVFQSPFELEGGPLRRKSANGKHGSPAFCSSRCGHGRGCVLSATDKFVIVLPQATDKIISRSDIRFLPATKLQTIHKPRHLLLKQMEAADAVFDTGPKPMFLTNKFKSTRAQAWLVFSFSAIAQVGLFAWLILDAADTQGKLKDFELGNTATCPASRSQTAVIVKVLLAGAALIGTGIGLFLLSQNPFDVKKAIDF
jgi:hypothetical protein